MFRLILCAYIFNTGNAIDNVLSALLGDSGKHVDSFDQATNIASGKIGKAADYLYVPSVLLPKLAMLSFYFQVFPRRIHHYLIYFNAGLLVCTLVAGVLQPSFICNPFSAYWTVDGKCGDLFKTYQWLRYPNLFTDAIILVIPFPVLLKLQVSNVTTVKLIVAFLTGSLGISAILRMVSFNCTPIFEDPTWYLIEPSIYSIVEPSAYLICTIIPTLRHLTRRIAHFAGLSTSTNYASYGIGGPTRGVGAPVHSTLNSMSLKKGHIVNLKLAGDDVEKQKLGERSSGWSQIEASNGIGAFRAYDWSLGGIIRKTDVTMYVERKSMSERGNHADGREESSLDPKSITGVWLGARDGSGDEVPLKDRQGSSSGVTR